MKKTLVSLACTLALALGASAQTVNFAALPAVSKPTLLPNGYANLDWSNFYYVDPIWSGAGAGFKQGPNALDVAYIGGGWCELAQVACSASISPNAFGAFSASGFTAQSAIVAAGYHPETISVFAYNQGDLVGFQSYNLTTSLQQITFPANWGAITQLVMDSSKGTVVLYALNMPSASPHAEAEVIGSPPNATTNIGPTPSLPVIDPLPRGAEDSVSVGPKAPTVGPHAETAGPTALQSESANADLVYASPHAPTNVGPSAPRHIVDPDDSTSVGPKAPTVGPHAKTAGPIADSASVGPKAPTVGPHAKTAGPIADSASVGPKAPTVGPHAKTAGPIADSASVGPKAPTVGPHAPKNAGQASE